MKRSLLAFLLVLAVLPLGCSDNGSAPTTPGGGGSTTISISGTLQQSTGSLASIKGMGHAAVTATLPDYKIIAQALTTKRLYVVSTDAQGVFTFTVPSEDTYTFHILDDSYFYVGPLILATYDDAATEVPEGLETDTSDVELGDVVLSEGENVGVLSDGDVVTIDQDMLVDAVNGIPAGAATQGEGASSATGNALDLDGDGVINIMDSDDDGDGILDEFDADHVQEANCTVADFIGLFSNFRNNLDASGNLETSFNDQQYTITVEAMIAEGEADNIVSITVSGPAYLDNLVIMPVELASYDETRLWETYNDKQLLEDYFPQASNKRYGAFLNGSPSAHIWEEVEPGDVWIFELTYDHNGTEYTELMAKKINFVFEETPNTVTINGAPWTSSNMHDLPDTVIIKWNTLTNLPGMNYGVAYFPWVNGEQYDAEAGSLNAGVDADSLLFILSDTTLTGETIDYYHIDVVASDSYGDNASTMGGNISSQQAD